MSAHDCLRNPLGPVRMGSYTIRSHECPRGVSKVYAECTGGDEYDFCIPYMDDVMIYNNSFEDHINHLKKVLQRVCEKGVKLKVRKCNYLGRIVSPEEYRIDPLNVKAVQELKNNVPKQVGDINKLLKPNHFLSFYNVVIKT